MQQQPGYLKGLRMVHLALMASQCMVLGVVFYLVIQKHLPPVEKSVDKILQVAALLVAFGAGYTAAASFKGKIAAMLSTPLSLAEKASQYHSASIIQWAILEGACLFVISCFLIAGNYAFAAMAIVLMVYFALLAPSRIKIVMQLKLTDKEVDTLQ
ncbi:MAG: hypothetical protein ABIU63_00480 [Chitinophagaceae bacterium]